MGSQDKSPNSSNNMQRVKVYRLNEDGKWDDQGTGHVTVDYLERSEDLGLFVIDEEDNETLLLHRISSDDIYRKQEDTIISWRDHELSTELALSFQETTGCSYIWDHICNLQRNMHFNSLANETFNSISNELTELPPVELSTLPLILKMIVESGSTDPSRVTELILQDIFFFKKLMELFRICEDLENVDGLHLIFKIIRRIILLNSSSILEKVFGDELIMDIIGCLEYDPEASQAHHRNFLKEHVVFKEEIPIKDPLALSKIHQNYRLGYLKDVILPSSLDESTVANLNSIIHSNNAVVVSLLKDDSTFIKELFARLKSPTTSVSSKKNLAQSVLELYLKTCKSEIQKMQVEGFEDKLVHFLHEFCTLSKSLQIANQHRLFRDLVNEGIFDIISDILQSEDHKLVLTGTDILILFQSLDANILRSYVTQPESELFGLLVRNMLKDFGDDMHCQFLEILRSLLDPMMPGQLKENVVELFYEKHLGQLIDAITSSCYPNCDGAIDHDSVSLEEGSMQNIVKPEILLNICDLLCFCVLQHPYRIKCNFLLNNAIDKVLYLTRRREKYLVLAAIRFVRAVISRSDEHLMNHIVKNNLFKPIVDAFVANGDRYNLLNSAVLDLFEFIRKENLKVLLRYLVDTFWDQLTKFESLSSIHALKVKYEQLLESAGTRSIGTSLEQRKRLDERAMEKEEEDYFNEESDEEDSTSARISNAKRGRSQPSSLANGSLPSPSRRFGGLVDYEDDEDDADYKTPPIKLKDASDEDDGFLELPLKRKLVSEGEPELKRLQRARKGVKPREGVFAALCSTLGEAVLPSTRVTAKIPNVPLPNVKQKPAEEKHCTGSSDQSKTLEPERPTDQKQDVETPTDQRPDGKFENHTDLEEVSPTSYASQLNDSSDNRKLEKERTSSSSSFTDQLHESDDNLKLGEERPLLPTNSSEMAVNGS